MRAMHLLSLREANLARLRERPALRGMQGAVAASPNAAATVVVAETVAASGNTHRSRRTGRFLGCESVWAVELVG
jgi:hypothetical protein